MRRLLSSISTPAKTAAAANVAEAVRAHGHSHSHGGAAGGHHHHSHAAIEKEIEGKNLQQCKLVTVAGGATNVFFSITKIWFGSSGGSVALVADGFHALTDIVADIVSYVSISLSKRKLPRCRYPFGVGRLETSGAVFVAAILLIGGVLLLIQSLRSCVEELAHLLSATTATAVSATVATAAAAAAHAHAHAQSDVAGASPHAHGISDDSAADADVQDAHGHSHDSGAHHTHGAAHGHSHFDVTQYDEATGKQVVVWTMVVLAASSVICKELLFQWTRRVGKRAGSRVVVANAYHHRADAWSGAVALVGVGGQLIGIPGVDGVAGLVVSLSICKIGYSLLRDSIFEFFDCQNAEEVAEVREHLQEFHLRVRRGGGVTTERNSDLPPSAPSSDDGSSAAPAAGPSSDVQHSKIRYVNVFLMRHGHNYTLHVQLLVHETLSALQIKEAVDELEKLAKASIPVKETFISLLVCSPQTVPAAEYRQQLHKEVYGAEQQEDAHGPEADDPEMFVAAEGAIVNPSLEKCLRSIVSFHGFTQPIRYNWEKRIISSSNVCSSDCVRDVESVAKIYRCQLTESSPGACDAHCHGCESHSHSAALPETKKKQ